MLNEKRKLPKTTENNTRLREHGCPLASFSFLSSSKILYSLPSIYFTSILIVACCAAALLFIRRMFSVGPPVVPMMPPGEGNNQIATKIGWTAGHSGLGLRIGTATIKGRIACKSQQRLYGQQELGIRLANWEGHNKIATRSGAFKSQPRLDGQQVARNQACGIGSVPPVVTIELSWRGETCGCWPGRSRGRLRYT